MSRISTPRHVVVKASSRPSPEGYSVAKQITDLTISTHKLIRGLQRQIVEQRERIERLERGRQ